MDSRWTPQREQESTVSERKERARGVTTRVDLRRLSTLGVFSLFFSLRCLKGTSDILFLPLFFPLSSRHHHQHHHHQQQQPWPPASPSPSSPWPRSSPSPRASSPPPPPAPASSAAPPWESPASAPASRARPRPRRRRSPPWGPRSPSRPGGCWRPVGWGT